MNRDKPFILHHREPKEKICCFFLYDKSIPLLPYCPGCFKAPNDFATTVFKQLRRNRQSRHHTSLKYRRRKSRSKRKTPSIVLPVELPQTSTYKIKKPWYKASNTSVYKGVSWHKRDKKYAARFRFDGKSKHIGNYKEEIRAAIEVDRAVLGTTVPCYEKLNFATNVERQMIETMLYHHQKHSISSDSFIFSNNLSKDFNGYPNNFGEVAEQMMVTRNFLKREF